MYLCTESENSIDRSENSTNFWVRKWVHSGLPTYVGNSTGANLKLLQPVWKLDRPSLKTQFNQFWNSFKSEWNSFKSECELEISSVPARLILIKSRQKWTTQTRQKWAIHSNITTMKKARWNLSLVMLMICPFVVFYYISSNQNAVNSKICTVQVQIQRDFIFASAHTADLQCPRHEPRNSIDLNLSDKGNDSSYTFWQRLFYDYEILATVVFVHRTRDTSPAYTADTAGATSRRPPKYIKKRFPGLKRERWRRMTIAFSKNALL